jgi:hypothetical protein
VKVRFVFKAALVFFLFVLVVNVGFWVLVGLSFGPVEDLYRSGLVVKLKPFGRAYVFAHGSYDYGYEVPEPVPNWSIDLGPRTWGQSNLNSPVYHSMDLGDSEYSTLSYVNELREEGYTYVWGSWCRAGDHEFIMRYRNGTEVPWPDWVSRNERPGTTIPVFWGLGFVRI